MARSRSFVSQLDLLTPRYRPQPRPSVEQRFERWILGRSLRRTEFLAAQLATKRTITSELASSDVSAYRVDEQTVAINIRGPVRFDGGIVEGGNIDCRREVGSERSTFTIRTIGVAAGTDIVKTWEYPPRPGDTSDIPLEVSALVTTAELGLRSTE